MLPARGDVDTVAADSDYPLRVGRPPPVSSDVSGSGEHRSIAVVDDDDDNDTRLEAGLAATAAAAAAQGTPEIPAASRGAAAAARIEPDDHIEEVEASAMMEGVVTSCLEAPRSLVDIDVVVGAPQPHPCVPSALPIRPPFVVAKPVAAIRPVAVRVVRPIVPTKANPSTTATREAGKEEAAVRATQLIPSDDDRDVAKIVAAAPAAKRPPPPQHHPHRVPALEVLQQPTVPPHEAEAFYGAAHSQGLSGGDVQSAVLLSHEWHRKWTHQHETGHGYREGLVHDGDHNGSSRHVQGLLRVSDVAGGRAANEHPPSTADYLPPMDAYNSRSKNPRSAAATTSSSTTLAAFTSYSTPSPPVDMFFDDRYAGAKNPSPEDTFAEPRKRVRSALSELHKQQQQQQQQQQLTGHHQPLSLAVPPLLGFPAAATTAEGTATGGGPFRPVALRIPRPSTLRPVAGPGLHHHQQGCGPSWTELVPQDIFDEMLLYQDHKQLENSLPAFPGQGGGGGGGGGAIHRHHHSSDNTHRKHRHHSSPRALSPLTVTSSSGGSVVKGGAPANTALAINEPNRVVHIVEPDPRDGSVKSVLSSASLSTSSSSSSLSHLRRPRPLRSVRLAIREARDGLLQALASTGGCVPAEADGKFHQCLSVLEEHGNYKFAGEEGMWLSLTAPNYFGSLGTNDACDPRYTLGRMAFDMFSPTSLICSLQGNFNSVERVSDEERAAMLLHVPKALQDEVMANTTVLRTYNIVAAFTIEPPSEEFPDAPNRDVQRPIKGIMTTYGYTLPDPNVPNRLSIWITGGRIEPNGSPADVESWKRQFELHPAVHSLGEKAKLLAVKMLMGAHMHPMESDGSMEYTFTRPLGGHGIAYVDTLYCDKSLRIVRGHRGTIFVFTRLPDAPTQ